jgi:hypothetical protein
VREEGLIGWEARADKASGMTEDATGQERRTAQRYLCAGEAEMVVSGCGLRFRGRIANLSAGGCYLEIECGLERGTNVELCMEEEGMPLRLAAHILMRRRDGVGCRFTQVSPRKAHQIESLIAELAQLRAAEQSCR